MDPEVLAAGFGGFGAGVGEGSEQTNTSHASKGFIRFNAGTGKGSDQKKIELEWGTAPLARKLALDRGMHPDTT